MVCRMDFCYYRFESYAYNEDLLCVLLPVKKKFNDLYKTIKNTKHLPIPFLLLNT